MLFDIKNRNDMQPKNFNENDYKYLERSGRIEAGKVREFLNYWVSKYPIEHRDELISRFRAGENRQFTSAGFELILYACSQSLGYQVQVHPNIPNGGTRRPDFLLKDSRGQGIYLEGILASEEGKVEVGVQNVKNVLLEKVNTIESPNFYLALNENGFPSKAPSTKEIKSGLEQWLGKLNPDIVSSQYEDYGTLPSYHWEKDGWSLTFEAIPKKKEERGKGQRVIGLHSGEVCCPNIWESIRDAIKSKGGRYGELKNPFIVAVNYDTSPVDKIDEMQSLFGEEVYILNSSRTLSQTKMKRRPNGVWHGPNGPQYTGVSGVWIFNMVNCWNLAHRNATLYINPWARKRLPEDLLSLTHAEVVDNIMKWHDGNSLQDILKLPEVWPENENVI